MTELSPSQPPSTEANHFDLIQPKDDLELIRSHSVSELLLVELFTSYAFHSLIFCIVCRFYNTKAIGWCSVNAYLISFKHISNLCMCSDLVTNGNELESITIKRNLVSGNVKVDFSIDLVNLEFSFFSSLFFSNLFSTLESYSMFSYSVLFYIFYIIFFLFTCLCRLCNSVNK